MAETCFIIDDEPIEVMALELMLHEAFPDLSIYKETSGRKLLQLADRLKPDVLIADIHMPGIDGLELIKELRGVFPKMQIIVVSAYEDFEYAQRAI